jgi:hypothetical protein
MEHQTARRAKNGRYQDTLTTLASGKKSSGCTVYLERTLDGACFPGLSTDEFTLRNADHVVSSKFRGILDWIEDEVPILMAPQLWL